MGFSRGKGLKVLAHRLVRPAASTVGQPDRGLALRLGDFYWQEPGTTRGIRNIGTTRIEIAEFELK